MTCNDCANFGLRKSHLAQFGFGLCAVKSLGKWHTFSNRAPACEAFKPAAPESVSKRTMYLELQNNGKERLGDA